MGDATHISRSVLSVFAILHMAGAAFAIAQYIFFPEQVVDLVPDSVAVDQIRHLMTLFAVLPATFVTWDVLLLLGLRRGHREALAVGFIAGGAGLLGSTIHIAFARWELAATDGTVGALFVLLTAWTWRAWEAPDHSTPIR